VDEDVKDGEDDDDAIPYFWGVLAIMGGCSFVIPDAMIVLVMNRFFLNACFVLNYDGFKSKKRGEEKSWREVDWR